MTALTLPAPYIISPAEVPSLRWGILGAAGIANTFVEANQKHTNQQIVAVASRTPGNGAEFAKTHGLEVCDSYEALVAREDLDVIYIATWPGNHLEHALLAINAGKHVLIEKPVALSSKDAETIFAAARAKGVLAMEAMWTQYLPQYDAIRKVLESGQLGDLELIIVDFCQRLLHVDRLWSSGGGSAIFDCGIYPITFVYKALGYPTKIETSGILGRNGFEAEATIRMEFASGARAVATVSLLADIPNHGSIGGSQGALELMTPFFVPMGVELLPLGFNEVGDTYVDETGVDGHMGLSWQAQYFAKYVAEGLLESPIHGHQDTINCLKIAETACAQLGSATVK
jgi:predicted dehydrogenase